MSALHSRLQWAITIGVWAAVAVAGANLYVSKQAQSSESLRIDVLAAAVSGITKDRELVKLERDEIKRERADLDRLRREFETGRNQQVSDHDAFVKQQSAVDHFTDIAMQSIDPGNKSGWRNKRK